MFKYFLTFTEEFWNGQDPRYTVGRLEIHTDEERFAIEEVRFLTKKKSFYRFREIVDFKHYPLIGVWLIKLIIKLFYYEKIQ